MCCIFTCCGWMIDLIQRLWTFIMSCCIASAVCCSVLTASMAGISLGYNYSLAEYIDLKETNVSVYLKRGVFDDEISDDMDWRRSGRLPIANHIKDDNLMTGEGAGEASTLRSGRRLDDSIYQSNDKNRFEDSLMKMTAQAPDFIPSTTTSGEGMGLSQFISKSYFSNSMDKLKEIQGAINRRKMIEADRRHSVASPKTPYEDDRSVPNFPFPRPPEPMRRMDPEYFGTKVPTTWNSLRNAVPEVDINDPSKWIRPKLMPHAYTRDTNDPYSFTYPTPATPRPLPVRPSLPPTMRPKVQQKTEPTRSTQGLEINIPKSIDDEMDTFKEKLLVEKVDFPESKGSEYNKDIKNEQKPHYEDYEEEIKGVPLRRKREIYDIGGKVVTLDPKLSNNNKVGKTFPTLFTSAILNIDKIYEDNNGISEGNKYVGISKDENFESKLTYKNIGSKLISKLLSILNKVATINKPDKINENVFTTEGNMKATSQSFMKTLLSASFVK